MLSNWLQPIETDSIIKDLSLAVTRKENEYRTLKEKNISKYVGLQNRFSSFVGYI